eukprot:scaffold2908_cov257-Pinguiococcus_pyrenoidosus.AAC.23
MRTKKHEDAYRGASHQAEPVVGHSSRPPSTNKLKLSLLLDRCDGVWTGDDQPAHQRALPGARGSLCALLLLLAERSVYECQQKRSEDIESCWSKPAPTNGRCPGTEIHPRPGNMLRGGAPSIRLSADCGLL